jgi:uncharacterized protein (TIGR03435 family)
METTMANRFVSLVAFLGLMAAGWMNADQAATSNTAKSPQAETQAPAFEVAAIKPSDPAARNNGCFMKGQPGGQTFIGRCITARLLITYSYKIIDSQLMGGPNWLDTQLYDFDAKADHSLTRAELAPMFQTMLADRFKLQFHRETRTMPALALTVDKAGAKMKPNDGPNEWEIAIMPAPGSLIPKFKGTRCPVSYLSWWIAQRENRPVVDKTGLDGFWDFTLEFVPDGLGEGRRKGPTGEPMPALDGPTLATALREQLGLKLEPGKGPVDVYVIDHVEKATGN